MSLLPWAPLQPLRAQVNLPALGDAAAEGIGVGTERKVGEQIMREIWRDPDYVDDPVLGDYLDSIWLPLVAASRKRGNITADIDERFAWQTFLVRDRSVNAFALPGGYVGVHLGLIAITTSRDELASVLAHEMSHVTQRHIARSVANSQRQGILGLAGMILGILVASRSNSPDAMNAVIAGGQAAQVQGQLNFSRDVEREADRVGFGVLTTAGFAPAGMTAMFEKMQLASRLNDGNNYPYLRTHPLTTERIGESRARLGTGPVVFPKGTLEDVVMEARSRVLMDTRSDALLRLQRLDGDPVTGASLNDRLGALCAGALASKELRDYARADVASQAALGLVRGSPRSDARAERAVVMLRAEVLLAMGRADDAAALLRPDALGDAPGAAPSRALTMLRAQIALSPALHDAEAATRSAEALHTRVAVAPRDALAWDLLAQIEERLNQPLRSVRAQAESHYAIGDWSGAADRLRAGQRLARSGGPVDFIEASVIDARLRQIESQRRQLAAELRGDKGGGDDAEPPPQWVPKPALR